MLTIGAVESREQGSEIVISDTTLNTDKQPLGQFWHILPEMECLLTIDDVKV